MIIGAIVVSSGGDLRIEAIECEPAEIKGITESLAELAGLVKTAKGSST